MGAISRFKGERPVRVRVQLDFMFIRLVPDEGEEGRGWIVLLIERLNDLKGKKKGKKEKLSASR